MQLEYPKMNEELLSVFFLRWNEKSAQITGTILFVNKTFHSILIFNSMGEAKFYYIPF